MADPKLLPCPFCGGRAEFESCPAGHSTDVNSGTWSVGCHNSEVDCIGYQNLAHYARKVEAAEAWNTRNGILIDVEAERNVLQPWTMSFTMNENLHITISKADDSQVAIGAHYGLRYAPHTVKLLDLAELEKGLRIIRSL